MATLDPPLDVMRDQILACTELERAEIGWIAGASHRQSGPHYPENPPPPGNPSSEVDALDVPHAPSRGADMRVMTEALRVSHAEGRDNRLRHVIFSGRQWSNYAKNGIPPYTWRDYDGEDQHESHAHIERTDKDRTNLKPFEIGIDMDEATRNHIIAMAYRTLAVFSDSPETLEYTLTVGGKQVKRREANVLHQRLAALSADVEALKAAVAAGRPVSDEQVTALGDQLAAAVVPGVVGGIGALQFVPTPSA